jgi:DNA polymerase-3 subunit chi
VSEPCQVDFYVLSGSVPSPEQLACRLALMAWEQGHRIAVLARDDEAARSLDEQLWQDPPGRFMPHALADVADSGQKDAPVEIVSGGQTIGENRDLVINLCPDPVPEPSRFRRLCEIVPARAEQRTASRQKFRIYREQGLDPVSHTIGKNG